MSIGMKKIIGVFVLFIVVSGLTAILSPFFLDVYNIENLLRRSALFGIISIGAAFVIMTGGIDLSIGSVVALTACLVPWMLVDQDVSPWLVIPFAVGISLLIGFVHGVLVTRLKIQPFIVTLCGLLLYRGIARWITDDQTVGFKGEYAGLQSLGNGRIELPFTEEFAIPTPFAILVIVAVLAIVFLRMTIWGRWTLATGRNESAARYAGIPTKRVTTGAYVLCSLLAGIGGMLFVFDVGSAQPADFGSFYELYAIAAAVLGGCSLRGGEGAIIGVVLGAALMQVLRNAITLIDWIPDNVEFAVIGAVILAGAIADELVRRFMSGRIRKFGRGDEPAKRGYAEATNPGEKT